MVFFNMKILVVNLWMFSKKLVCHFSLTLFEFIYFNLRFSKGFFIDMHTLHYALRIELNFAMKWFFMKFQIFNVVNGLF